MTITLGSARGASTPVHGSTSRNHNADIRELGHAAPRPTAFGRPAATDVRRARGRVEKLTPTTIVIRIDDGQVFTYALLGELDCTNGGAFVASGQFEGLAVGSGVWVTTCDKPDDLRAALRRRAASRQARSA